MIATDDEAHILGQHDFTVSTTKVERVMHRVTPPLIRMERLISTPVNFVILPIFAFVNAQVRLVGVDMSTLLTDPVTLGVYFGMLLGKPIGIFGMTFALVKLKISELPNNVNWHMIAGVGILGGIGFTMSILISGLAFPTAQFEVLAAKAAILAGSVTAAVLGMIYMSVVCKHPGAQRRVRARKPAPEPIRARSKCGFGRCLPPARHASGQKTPFVSTVTNGVSF